MPAFQLQRGVQSAALLLIASSAWAGDRTVALTQVELQSLRAAEQAAAIASYLAQQAKPVYDKMDKAFTPDPVK